MAEPSYSYSLEDISAEFDCDIIEGDSSELEESSDEDDYSWIPVLEDDNEFGYDFDNTICGAKHIRSGMPGPMYYLD